AAKTAAAEQISLEVIDLRSLSPLDMDTVMASVRKTHRAVVVHEAPVFCGFGAEVAARISHDAFDLLEAPVARIGGLTVPYPPARPGESVAVGEPLVTITAAEAAQAEATPGTLVGYGPGAPESGIRRKARSAPAAAESSGDVRAAPFVRQLAKDMGLDLAQVTGSGPGGRITRADVEAAASSPAGA